ERVDPPAGAEVVGGDDLADEPEDPGEPRGERENRRRPGQAPARVSPVHVASIGRAPADSGGGPCSTGGVLVGWLRSFVRGLVRAFGPDPRPGWGFRPTSLCGRGYRLTPRGWVPSSCRRCAERRRRRFTRRDDAHCHQGRWGQTGLCYDRAARRAGVFYVMPNIKQQKKRVRIATRERVENQRYRSTVTNLTKALQTAIADGDKERAAAEHRELVRAIDKASSRKALPRNTAARKKAQAARLLSGS